MNPQKGRSQPESYAGSLQDSDTSGVYQRARGWPAGKSPFTRGFGNGK